jgi:hypothetical protein
MDEDDAESFLWLSGFYILSTLKRCIILEYCFPTWPAFAVNIGSNEIRAD